MKKCSLILSLVFALAIGLISGCGENEETINDAVQEVKIGLNLELTGPLSSYGTEEANGIVMALEEINQADGINGIKVIPLKVDNRSDAVRAAFLANTLMTQDGVVAVIGPATSNNFIATIPAAMENKIPTISATATADKITVDNKGNVYDYVFRIIFNDSFQGISMANFAAKNLGAKKAIVIQNRTSAYSKGLGNNFIEAFKADGGTIVAQESYSINQTDFNAMLTNIKEQEFDVIYFPGYYLEAGPFIKQARELGITEPILGGDAFDSPILLGLAGASSLNNVYFTNSFSPLDQDPLVQDFIVAYREKYGEEPNAFSALGYDAGKFIADAIKRAGSTDPTAIKDALASTENFVGVTGTFSMSKDHNPIKSIVVTRLENGVPVSSVKVEP